MTDKPQPLSAEELNGYRKTVAVFQNEPSGKMMGRLLATIDAQAAEIERLRSEAETAELERDEALARMAVLREALKIISQTVHEHANGPCDCLNSGDCITEWCDSAVAKQALSTLDDRAAKMLAVVEAAVKYIEATGLHDHLESARFEDLVEAVEALQTKGGEG
jgi:type II secretory pathway component PulM